MPLTGEEPPARIVIDPPVAEWLARGMVVIQYRAENLRIVQVFGPNALDVSPRIGHVHVTVDDAPWHWADASGEPIIITRLPAGPHKVLIELVNANHQTLDQGVDFVIPAAIRPGGRSVEGPARCRTVSRRAAGQLRGVLLVPAFAPGDRVRVATCSPVGHYRAAREASP